MTTVHCAGGSGCISTDVQPYKRYIGHGLTLLCSNCAAALQAIGMSLTLVERRAVDLPVIEERRRIFRARWLDRLTNRDDTGRLSA